MPTKDQALCVAVRTMLRPHRNTTTFLRDGFKTAAEAVQSVCREWPKLSEAARLTIRSEVSAAFNRVKFGEAEREVWEPVVKLILDMP